MPTSVASLRHGAAISCSFSALPLRDTLVGWCDLFSSPSAVIQFGDGRSVRLTDKPVTEIYPPPPPLSHNAFPFQLLSKVSLTDAALRLKLGSCCQSDAIIRFSERQRKTRTRPKSSVCYPQTERLNGD